MHERKTTFLCRGRVYYKATDTDAHTHTLSFNLSRTSIQTDSPQTLHCREQPEAPLAALRLVVTQYEEIEPHKKNPSLSYKSCFSTCTTVSVT